jgi:hypothetical protein
MIDSDNMKRLCISCALVFYALVAAAALDRTVTPFIQAGTGQAYGSLFSTRGDWFAEWWKGSSYSDTGSYSPYFPILLGGIGADLTLSNGSSWWKRGRRSLVYGVELGAWGGAIKCETADGDDIASTRIRSLVLSFKADERFRFPLGDKSYMALSLGPLLGFNCRYFSQEYDNGIYSYTSLRPRLADVLFLGFDLGYDFGFKLGRGNLVLGLRGDVGLTQLSSVNGALGDKIAWPWRALGRVGYEIPIGKSRREVEE